jgi:hypothetical protein
MSCQVQVCFVLFAIVAYPESGTTAVVAVGVVHNLLS